MINKIFNGKVMKLAMICLIKSIFIFLIITKNAYSLDNSAEKILFKINNKAYTTTDIENRNKYYKLIFFNENYIKSNTQNDLISLIFFNDFFEKNNKSKEYNIDETYRNIFSKYEKNKENIFLNNLFNELGKEKLLYYLDLELKRKFIIEEILNSQKNLIIKNFDEDELLYDVFLKYYILKLNDFNKINKNYNIENFDDSSLLENLFNENNIEYLYKEDLLNNNNLNINIEKSLKNNENVFKIEQNNYLVIGFINKKLKSYKGINVQLVNIKAKDEIPEDLLKCDKLNMINNDIIENISTGYYEYKNLNDQIKNNLYLIDNYIKIINNDIINYIMLCELSFNKEIFNEITINQKVNNLAYKIEEEFVKKYSKIYNVIILNEK